VTKNDRFLKSARVRKRAFLARAKKISGKKWFVFNEHEVLFFSKNALKKEKCVEITICSIKKRKTFSHELNFPDQRDGSSRVRVEGWVPLPC
jgi:hypothetical protein